MHEMCGDDHNTVNHSDYTGLQCVATLPDFDAVFCVLDEDGPLVWKQFQKDPNISHRSDGIGHETQKNKGSEEIDLIQGNAYHVQKD